MPRTQRHKTSPHLLSKKSSLPLEIQKKLARLASFTELNPRPVIEVDFEGNILDANSSATTYFPTLKTKQSKHQYLANLKDIIKILKKDKKPFTREIKIKNKWFRQVFYLVPNLKLIHIFSSDITDRKKTEEDLKKSEKRYRTLFEKMEYGYALQDIIYDKRGKPVDYRFIDVNPAFEKLAQFKKENIIGKTANELAARAPQTKEQIKTRKDYDRVAFTGEPLYLESYNANLNKYFKLYAYKPNNNQIALIFSDITKEKNTQEERNNFISILSHELRNPLTPILANAQFINALLEQNDRNPVIIKESISIIEKEAKLMAGLLNDILDVSRLARKKINLEKKKIDVCEDIKNAVKASMPFITTKNQHISVTFSHDPIYINADPLRIQQIMINLINNASKYTQEGGRIQVLCNLTTVPKSARVHISVKDNGQGMNKEKISRIFELFNNEGQPFLGVGGLGIGLNIVKNLVQMHGGTISVTSKGEQKGSEFLVTLPALKKNTGSILKFLEKKSETIQRETTSRVLVVDDNKDIRETVSKILQQEGHVTKSTSHGREAVRISKTFKPHVALIDIGLPDINGYKVAKLLKQQKGIKLIAFTGYGQKKDKKRAVDAGFDAHITKPVDVNNLIRAVQTKTG